MRSFPELSHLSKARRSELLCGAKGTTLNIAVQSALIGVICGGAVVATLLRPSGGNWLIAFPLGVCAGMIGFAVCYQIQMLRVRTALRLGIMDALRGQRVPVCLSCGYDLRGLEETKLAGQSAGHDRCPECGARIVVPDR